MRIKIILLALLTVFLTSCSSDNLFEKHHDFDNNTWAKSEQVVFDVTIEDTSEPYDIFIVIRQASAYPYANVVVGLTIETPAGEKRMMEHSFIIRNEDGSFKGDGLGDIYDITLPIFENFPMNYEGTYRFVFDNRMHLVEMPGIMSIGLIIKKKGEEK